MAKARVAINGFGRTGRCLTRQIYHSSTLELVAINSRSPLDKFLLTSDSTYGRFEASVELEEKVKNRGKKQIIEKYLHINKLVVPVYEGDEPIALPWEELQVDIVVDATGNFPTKKGIIDHINAGAQNVIMTYPPNNNSEIKTIMIGINEKIYDFTGDPDLKRIKDCIISAGSCTSLALAPLLKYLDQRWEITHCAFLTTHCYTDSQNLLDNTNKDQHRARAGSLNIIPTSTGAQQNIPAVLPNLEGKIIGMANRVPVPWGSQLFLQVDLVKETTAEEVNTYFTALAQKQDPSLIGVCTEPAYSSYFRGDSHAVVVDPEWTSVSENKKLRMVAWFDNEWGYCARLVELLNFVASKNKKKWF